MTVLLAVGVNPKLMTPENVCDLSSQWALGHVQFSVVDHVSTRTVYIVRNFQIDHEKAIDFHCTWDMFS